MAEAFGPHDGADRIGMFRRSELELFKSEACGPVYAQVERQSAAAHTADGGAGGSNARGSVGGGAGVGSGATGGTARNRDTHARGVVADQRGDTRTDVAIVSNCFSERLYNLFLTANVESDDAAARKGVWAEPLRNLREACHELQRTGNYRPPKVYKVSVMLMVLVSIAVDSCLMAQHVGEPHPPPPPPRMPLG